MNKSVEETRRELFEHHMGIPESVTWSNETSSYIGQNFWLVEYAWGAFNAALDIVEIELPESVQCGNKYYPWEGVCADQFRTTIESLNLGIKVK